MKSTRKTSAILAVTAALTLVLATSASAEERPRDGTWRDHNNATARDGSRSNDGTRHESRNNNGYRNESRNNGNNSYRNESRNNNTYRNETRSNDGYRNESRNNNGYRNESRSNGYRNESRRDGFRGESRHDDHINMRGRITRFSHERDGYRVWLDRDSRSFWIPESRLGRHRLGVGLELRLGGIFNGGYVAVDALGWPGDPYYNDPYYGGGYYNNAYASGYLSGRVERVDPRYGTLLLRDDRSGRVVEVDMRATDRGRVDLDDLRPGDRVALDGSWDGRFFHAYRIDGVRPY